MRKLIALVLTASLLAGSPSGLFAQALQNKQPQSFNDYVAQAQKDKLVFQQAGIGNTKSIIGIVLSGAAFLSVIFHLSQKNANLTAQLKDSEVNYLKGEKLRNAQAQDELVNFLKTEKSSKTFKIIDQAAKDLGSDLDPELYASIKADAYELRKMFLKFREPKMNQYYLDVYRNPEVLKELMSKTVYERTFSIYTAPELLIERCPYVRYQQSIKNLKERFIKIIENAGKETVGIEAKDVTLSAAGKELIEKVLKYKVLISVTVLLAIATLPSAAQEQVKHIGDNPELALDLNPVTDAQVIAAIEGNKDLKEALIPEFVVFHKAAKEISNKPQQEQRNAADSFAKGYKEQTKNYNYDNQKAKEVKSQGNSMTSGMSKFDK